MSVSGLNSTLAVKKWKYLNKQKTSQEKEMGGDISYALHKTSKNLNSWRGKHTHKTRIDSISLHSN